MGFIEKFYEEFDDKSDLEEHNVEVDESKDTEDTHSSMIENKEKKQSITYRPPAVTLEDVKNHLDIFDQKGVAGYARKDLVLPLSGMLESRNDNNDILKEYRGVLKEEYYNPLVIAYTIIEFEDKGDPENSGELYKKLISRYGDVGKHIYNFTRSGLIQGEFLVYLNYLRIEGKDGYILKTEFNSYFEDQLDFYPYAIWIDEMMSKKELLEEIRKRFNLKDTKVEKLRIYARGRTKIRLLNTIITDYVGMNKSLEKERVERYEICNTPCRCLIIKRSFKEEE